MAYKYAPHLDAVDESILYAHSRKTGKQRIFKVGGQERLCEEWVSQGSFEVGNWYRPVPHGTIRDKC